MENMLLQQRFCYLTTKNVTKKSDFRVTFPHFIFWEIKEFFDSMRAREGA